MGGDHKCPVCQATFTRPQHVARHMRSHTGDRPYKCQHCGDQFARSDLLSRHVNKCHASEKPLQNPGGPRRKGTVSATRATTSKQSCDQCVVSTIPCDGCNPCSKCVSRKARCTFVKFHRQTAPIGPGHNTRPTVPADSTSAGSLPSSGSSLPSSAFSDGGPSSRPPLYQHSDDEFVLGPAPGSVPTMAESLYGTNSFAFPPLYPPNPELNAMPDNLDYGAKYRAQQPEFFGPGRSGMGTGLTPLYDPRHGTSTPNPTWLNNWGTQDPHEGFHHPQHQGARQAEMVPNHGPSSVHAASNFGNQNPADNPPIPMTMPYPAVFALPRLHSSRHPHGQGRNSASSYDSSSSSRRGSYSESESTSVSGHASGSVPCSANNSNVHLPSGNAGVNSLGYGNTEYTLASNVPDRTSSSSSDSSQHGRYNPQEDRHEFSSAFGLLSLEDPAVMAGLAVDGQPFFDDPTQVHNRQESTDPEQNHDGLLTTDIGPDIDTPMPLKRDATHIQLPSLGQRHTTSNGAPGPGSGGATGSEFGTNFGTGNLPTPSPSRDADSRELREFWRDYMRTPLSGPHDATGNIVGPSMISPKNPSPTHRRQRVASLPAAKTPMVERDEMFVQGFGYHPPHQPDQRGRGNAAALGPTSSLRTTLHVKEDLRSYEAAVMARKAPMLNLQLKRPVKGKATSTNPQPQGRCEPRIIKDSQRSNASPQSGYASRPPSSSGVPRSSSALANAFGDHGNGPVSLTSLQSMTGKEESVSPSLSSSRHTSVDAYPTSASDVESRPSFKRLASQTLGPENSKRAFFGYDGDEMGERDETAGWSTTVQEVPLNEFGGCINGTTHPVGSIAERRRRRMSAPSSIVDLNGQHSQPTGPLGYAPAAQGCGAG